MADTIVSAATDAQSTPLPSAHTADLASVACYSWCFFVVALAGLLAHR